MKTTRAMFDLSLVSSRGQGTVFWSAHFGRALSAAELAFAERILATQIGVVIADGR